MFHCQLRHSEFPLRILDDIDIEIDIETRLCVRPNHKTITAWVADADKINDPGRLEGPFCLKVGPLPILETES